MKPEYLIYVISGCVFFGFLIYEKVRYHRLKEKLRKREIQVFKAGLKEEYAIGMNELKGKTIDEQSEVINRMLADIK